MAVFADVHYCTFADIVGGWVNKVQICADVIHGWSPCLAYWAHLWNLKARTKFSSMITVKLQTVDCLG